jgi:hypothetical protein
VVAAAATVTVGWVSVARRVDVAGIGDAVVVGTREGAAVTVAGCVCTRGVAVAVGVGAGETAHATALAASRLMSPYLSAILWYTAPFASGQVTAIP